MTGRAGPSRRSLLIALVAGGFWEAFHFAGLARAAPGELVAPASWNPSTFKRTLHTAAKVARRDARLKDAQMLAPFDLWWGIK